MPRLGGLNLVAVLAAAVLIYFIGAIIFGVVASDLWAKETLVDHGLVLRADLATLTGADAKSRAMEIPGAMAMGPALGLGFVISLVTAIGLAATLRMTKPKSLSDALGAAAVLWSAFGVTTLAYAVVYSSDSVAVFMLQAGHLLLDFLAGSAVIFLIDGKAFRAAT